MRSASDRVGTTVNARTVTWQGSSRVSSGFWWTLALGQHAQRVRPRRHHRERAHRHLAGQQQGFIRVLLVLSRQPSMRSAPDRLGTTVNARIVTCAPHGRVCIGFWR